MTILGTWQYLLLGVKGTFLTVAIYLLCLLAVIIGDTRAVSFHLKEDDEECG